MHQTIAQSFARRSLEALQNRVDIRTRASTTADRQPAQHEPVDARFWTAGRNKRAVA